MEAMTKLKSILNQMDRLAGDGVCFENKVKFISSIIVRENTEQIIKSLKQINFSEEFKAKPYKFTFVKISKLNCQIQKYKYSLVYYIQCALCEKEFKNEVNICGLKNLTDNIICEVCYDEFVESMAV